MRWRRVSWMVLGLLILAVFWGCPQTSEKKPAEKPIVRLKLATTTSTQDSGLLDILLPPFEERYNVRVDVIAVGTGKALRLGERGDVDVLLVHAPDAEKRFVEQGFGVNRRAVMANDFVIVGPASDPVQIRGSDAVAALQKIAESQALFVSRGDESGTHKKERSLWQLAGLTPAGDWYLEVGQGMGATLRIASEREAYCLTDRGTYLALRDTVDLTVLCEGDPRLRNPYSVIAVNPARHAHVRYMEAMMLIAWLTSPEGQQIIGGYKKYGTLLFHPSAQ